MYAIGFMTSEKNRVVSDAFGEKEVANIFIPTSQTKLCNAICIPKEDVRVLGYRYRNSI